jgi:Bifunctional DNA primase/polymerase, N-terminal
MGPIFLEGEPLPVFPCPANKKPATPHGFKDATANPNEVAVLWQRHSGFIVLAPTGSISRLDIVDIDPRNAGCRFSEIVSESMLLPREVAERVLLSAAQLSGLKRDDAIAATKRTIASGLSTWRTR